MISHLCVCNLVPPNNEACICPWYTVMMTHLYAGFFWIDPNEGSPKDAVKVFCQGAETCLKPANVKSQVSAQEDKVLAVLVVQCCELFMFKLFIAHIWTKEACNA